jgi:Dyp-type peroxidase family
MPLDRQDVQGFIIKGYGYPLTRVLLLSFPDEARGKSFLRWVSPQITSACPWSRGAKPEPLVNLGLTYRGLQVIGLQAVLQKNVNRKLVLAPSPPLHNPFPLEFRQPPSEQTLGDKSDQDKPETWWNGKGNDAIFPLLHAALFVYAKTTAVLDASVAQILAKAGELGVEQLVTGADGLPLGGPALSGRRVHFGYVDGVGQPDVDWDNSTPVAGKVARRHFLLGEPTSDVQSSPDPVQTLDFFVNSGYAAFRWMSQDVPAFEEYLTQNGPKLAPHLPLADARELLAAKLIGRWRSGAPLVVSPNQDDPSLANVNQFKYEPQDSDGMRCPFSAHIRVTNPRDEQLKDNAKDDGVPPLLRRGLSYGPEWIRGTNDNADRGLLGLFLCVSLERQFQKIMRWMNVNDFSPVFDSILPTPVDPLSTIVGRVPGQQYLIPTAAGPVSIPLARSFVRSRGTAYFLLPGITTLNRMLV